MILSVSLLSFTSAPTPPVAAGFLRLRAVPVAGALPAGFTEADLPSAIVTGVKVTMGGRSAGRQQTKASLAAIGLQLALLG